jgi:hypothetical protein
MLHDVTAATAKKQTQKYCAKREENCKNKEDKQLKK